MRGVPGSRMEWWRCYSYWARPCEFVGRACVHCGRLTSMDLVHAQREGLKEKNMMTPVEPMTTGKGKLRHQIKELETEIEQLKNRPLQKEVARLQGELQRLQVELDVLKAYCSMIETRAEALVQSALEFAQTINLSKSSPQGPIDRQGDEVQVFRDG